MIVPTYMRWEDFCGQLNNLLPHLVIPLCGKEEDWAEWAIDFIDINDLHFLPLPSEKEKKGKTGWKRWSLNLFMFVL